MSLDISYYLDVDVGTTEPYRVELFSRNITHNLAIMAREAGIYYELWRPEKAGISKAGELIVPLRNALKNINDDPSRFDRFDAPNGWGTRENLVDFLRDCLDGAEKFPKSLVDAWT